jgi:hypothetical protein
MKRILLVVMLQGCSTLEWSNSYGTDFCAYPSGIIVGAGSGTAAGLIAGPVWGLGVGAFMGGTMLLNAWGNYGGLNVEDCIDSYKRNVLNESKDTGTGNSDSASY